jgi:hypothetical protein
MEGRASVNESVIVAVISALGLVLASALPAFLVQAFRRENAQDHAQVSDRLEGIDAHIGVVEAKVEKMNYQLGTHLLEHERNEEENGNTRRTDAKTSGD